jgi:hypothetical protein
MSSDYDNKASDDDDDIKSKENQTKEVLTANEQAMSDILNVKRQEVITALIDCLSVKNKEDFEACLNAH